MTTEQPPVPDGAAPDLPSAEAKRIAARRRFLARGAAGGSGLLIVTLVHQRAFAQQLQWLPERNTPGEKLRPPPVDPGPGNMRSRFGHSAQPHASPRIGEGRRFGRFGTPAPADDVFLNVHPPIDTIKPLPVSSALPIDNWHPPIGNANPPVTPPQTHGIMVSSALTCTSLHGNAVSTVTMIDSVSHAQVTRVDCVRE